MKERNAARSDHDQIRRDLLNSEEALDDMIRPWDQVSRKNAQLESQVKFLQGELDKVDGIREGFSDEREDDLRRLVEDKSNAIQESNDTRRTLQNHISNEAMDAVISSALEEDLDNAKKALMDRTAQAEDVKKSLAERVTELVEVKQSLEKRSQDLNAVRRSLAERSVDLDAAQELLAENSGSDQELRASLINTG